MNVRTTRFGDVEIAEDRVITFPKALPGFPERLRFCLLEPTEDACFFWLQSVDDPTLAFVVTDPGWFFKDYAIPLRAEQMQELGLARLDDAQVFIIVNKVDGELTGNLQGPIVINTVTRRAEQLVLADRKWSTRHTLPSMQKPEPVHALAASA
ncbi:MAG: flagellar assembly protein FliW [Phycisphaerales bacterium]